MEDGRGGEPAAVQPGRADQLDVELHARVLRRPLGAEAHENAFHWYDRGGLLPRGLSLALNTTGRPERVLGPGQGGNTYNISVMVPVSANKADTGRQVVEAIKEFERRSGAGWRN